MSDRFKIKGSEINEVILNSPFSLADSPARLGQRASQTKRYFYQFINTLAEKINLHLGEIDKAIADGELGIADMQDMIAELGEKTALALLEHNANEGAHNDIRKKITDENNSHNQSASAHKDIRDELDTLGVEISVALALASGKSRIASFDDEVELFEYALSNGSVGDILLLEDPLKPDFTIFGVGVDQKDGDVALDINDVATGIQLLPNKKYFIDGVRLVSSEGHLETSLFAKRDELNEQKSYFLEALEAINERVGVAEEAIKGKEQALTKHTITSQSVYLESMNEYHLGTVTDLIIDLADDEFFEAILCFKTGNGEISANAPEELLFTGDDTLEGRFYPVSKRLYEISIKRVSGVMLARVGSVDYEVIM